MDYVVVRTHVINHERFLEAGATARDLWQWGMLYAGQHETDGELPMVAILASPWGHGGKRNVLLANKLVDVGLWERTDKGYRIRKWAEQGNKTKEQMGAAREKARRRMKDRRLLAVLPAVNSNDDRSPDVHANYERTSLDVPSSTSTSLSSGSDPKSQKTRGTAPEWFLETVTLLEANAPDVHRGLGAIGERWLQYQGAIRRGRGANAAEAAAWLTSTIRRERAEAESRTSKGTPRQPLGNRDEHDWLKTGGGGDF